MAVDLHGHTAVNNSRDERAGTSTRGNPPQDPAPWEEQTAPLGRLLRGTTTRPNRVVVYRRPVEARAQDDLDLADIVREVVTEQVAALLGVPPQEIDPGMDPDA